MNQQKFIYHIIKKPSKLSIIKNDFLFKPFYYKIKNNTNQSIIIYKIKNKMSVNSNGKIYQKNNNSFHIKTVEIYDEELEKIKIKPNQKIKINFPSYGFYYSVNNQSHFVNNINVYDKITFENEPELKSTNVIIY
jgi:hypothetical protein